VLINNFIQVVAVVSSDVEILHFFYKEKYFVMGCSKCTQGDPKNRTHENFIKSYEDLVNFKHFSGFKLQSVYIIPQIKVPSQKSHVLSKICSKWPPQR